MPRFPLLMLMLLMCGNVPVAALDQAWAQVHVSTDKAIYRSGETIHLRGVLLDPRSRVPMRKPITARVSLFTPRGEVAISGDTMAVDGSIGQALAIPADASGGTWKVVVHGSRFLAPAERTFEVQAMTMPRLNTVISFRRDAYGPGEEVIADLSVQRVEGGVPLGEVVEIIARVAGNEVQRLRATVDAQGQCQARIRLPTDLGQGDGTLAVLVGSGAAQESVTRPLPLAAVPPDVRLYPEGGDLVAGLHTRLYAEAFLGDGRPAEFAGVIVDDLQQVVSTITSVHEGRGCCDFVPRPGRIYHLALSRPLSARYPLPEVLPAGAALRALDEMTGRDQPLRLALASTTPGAHRLEVTNRGHLIVTHDLALALEPVQVEIPLPTTAHGVLTATLRRVMPDGANLAVAERLVFRQPQRSLAVRISSDRSEVLPDGSVSMTISTHDEDGKPVSALVGVTASDDSVRLRLPRREHPPRLPAMALLETDVRNLADAAIYLDRQHPLAHVALDLLLGTQGWRRFASRDPGTFVAAHGDAARRVLALCDGDRAPLLRPSPKVFLQAPPGKPQLPPAGVQPPTPVIPQPGPMDANTDGAFMAIGSGRTPGVLGARSGGHKRRALARYGGTRASESAVDAALQFFKRHQSPDGGWSLADHPTNCSEEPKCEPGPLWANRDGDVAATALALLAFHGAGYDHQTPNKYRATIQRALGFLRAQQTAPGVFSTTTWPQALATQALCETFAMTKDPALRLTCGNAIAVLQALATTPPLGFDDILPDGTRLTTLTSYAAITALRMAHEAGLNVSDAMDAARARLQQAWVLANPEAARLDNNLPFCFPAQWHQEHLLRQGPQQRGMGAMLAFWLGLGDDPCVQAARDASEREPLPAAWPWELSSVHATSLAHLFFRVGWERWNQAIRDPLIAQQIRGKGCFDGSWPSQGTSNFSPDGGRLFSTAHACRILQVYYAYHHSLHVHDQQPTTVLLPEHREYAHRPPPLRTPSAGSTDTVYWHRGILTAADSGTAVIHFTSPGHTATLRICADAVDGDGALGSGDALVHVVPPFAVNARLPSVLMQGDQVLVPVSMHDRRAGADVVHLTTEMVGVAGGQPATIVLAADGRGAAWMPLEARDLGPARFSLQATAGDQQQTLVRTLDIQPPGFPAVQYASGTIPADGAVNHTLVLPADTLGGSGMLSVRLFPHTMFSAIAASESLQAEPHGCFEQTSSTLYPMLMAQRLLLERTTAPVALIRRGQEFIGKGAKRLWGFEVPGGGFEWFGRVPAHPTLTAYGLMQFNDLAVVQQVDPALINRTRSWLLAQRDGAGGFRHPGGGHGWQADQDSADAYVLWALLTSAGDQGPALGQDLQREFDRLAERGRTSSNAYVIALAANALALAGRTEDARASRDRLVIGDDGLVRGSERDFLGSDERSLRIATTALACLAWISADADDARTVTAISGIRRHDSRGRFGNTQATVLALRAILTHERLLAATPRAPTTVSVRLDDGVAQTRVITASELAPEPLDFAFLAGTRTVTLSMPRGTALPWSLTLTSQMRLPPSDPACLVRLTTTLSTARATVGEPLECQVHLHNPGRLPVPSPIAIIPLPGGVEPDHEHLRGLVKGARIAAYEITANKIVLYWDALAADSSSSLHLLLLATIPGTFSAPAARAYGYYSDAHQWWCEPLRLEIMPR